MHLLSFALTAAAAATTVWIELLLFGSCSSCAETRASPERRSLTIVVLVHKRCILLSSLTRISLPIPSCMWLPCVSPANSILCAHTHRPPCSLFSHHSTTTLPPTILSLSSSIHHLTSSSLIHNSTVRQISAESLTYLRASLLFRSLRRCDADPTCFSLIVSIVYEPFFESSLDNTLFMNVFRGSVTTH